MYLFSVLKSFINCGGKKYCPNQEKKNINSHLCQMYLFTQQIAWGRHYVYFSALQYLKEVVASAGSTDENV